MLNVCTIHRDIHMYTFPSLSRLDFN